MLSASEAVLKSLSEMLEQAHARIQAKHAGINPVVGVRRGMRDTGIPADVVSVACLSARRRILFVLHDQSPGVLLYQFTALDDEADNNFEQVGLDHVDVDTLMQWMESQFST